MFGELTGEGKGEGRNTISGATETIWGKEYGGVDEGSSREYHKL